MFVQLFVIVLLIIFNQMWRIIYSQFLLYGPEGALVFFISVEISLAYKSSHDLLANVR